MKKKWMKCGAWVTLPYGEDWDKIWYEHNKLYHAKEDSYQLAFANHPDLQVLDDELDNFYGPECWPE